MNVRVRELPPLRHTIEIETPAGRNYRWASDAPNARDIPTNVTSSSTMPGGFEQFTATLPRKPNETYDDLVRLATVRERDATGEIVGEFRLERTPRVSGEQMAINPAANGWQAHLTDNQTAQLLAIDRDLGRWRGPSRSRLLILLAASNMEQGFQVQPDETAGTPALMTGWNSAAESAILTSEAWYDAGPGNLIGRVRATWTRRGINEAVTSNDWRIRIHDNDDGSTGSNDDTGNLRATGPGTVDLASTGRRFVIARYLYGTAANWSGAAFAGIEWTNVRVFGDHGLTIRGSTAAEEGFSASDLVAYIVRRFAPMLKFTEGVDGTIKPSTFIIPQFAHLEPTNAGELIRQASRFGLEDWAVWPGREFHWHPRGEGLLTRHWFARVGPSGLEETGPQVDRLWNGVVVQYRDVAGETRTVGPPGSGAGTESSSLIDTDPDNPANQLGIRRWALLSANQPLPAAAATVLGRVFLAESKRLDTSGRARFVGHVMDERGILWPYSRVKAGDTVTFIDAADSSPRRIVRAEYSRSEQSVTVDLDAPPEGLQALLERLDVSLAALGV